MAQYVEYTDSSTNCRDGVRDGAYVIDVELTILGFDGSINIDWENLETIAP